MRKTLALLASAALAVLVVGGVALAATITCPNSGDSGCVGTPEDDTMTGTADRDAINGRTGNDTIYGRGFPDSLTGDAGNDTLRGEGGPDFLQGDNYQQFPYQAPSTGVTIGDDRLFGGPHHDRLYSGDGDDTLRGGPGNDELHGRFISCETCSNYDKMYGEEGDDNIEAYKGELYGGNGADWMHVSGGDSSINGGAGDDDLGGFTCLENSTTDVTGGPGEDVFGAGQFCPSTTSTATLRAVDGKQDTISCSNKEREIVRADPLDTFPEGEAFGAEFGREHCNRVTIVE